MNGPTFKRDVIGCVVDGEEIRVWNKVTVDMRHETMPNQIESHHKIWAGDGSTAESPDYITPDIDEQLEFLDVYPNAEVIDPSDDEVQIL